MPTRKKKSFSSLRLTCVIFSDDKRENLARLLKTVELSHGLYISCLDKK